MLLLFDIGGTNTKIAVSADGEALSDLKVIPTPRNFEEGINLLKQTACSLTNGRDFEKVAGGIAGPLNTEKTVLSASPHLPGWVGKLLQEKLEQIFNCTVVLENDVALAGLGEAVKGAGIGKKIVAFLAIGTGVGGVRIVDGHIDQNVLGFEPGHQIVVANGNPCDCGGRGHLEAYIGGSYLEKFHHKKSEEIEDEKIWDNVAKILSIGLNNTIVHFSPDVVVLGGSVAKSIPLEKVRIYLKNELRIFPQTPEIVLTELNDQAALYGALKLLR